jgi:Zn-dependent protease
LDELSNLNCSRCFAPLLPDDKVCSQCHALVHAAELEQLRAQALGFERQGEVLKAREAWRSAWQLLPPESKQAQWIEVHIHALEQTGAVTVAPAKANPWAKRLGPLAPLALLLAKGKTLLFALFKLKFLFSFVAFLGLYWALYGAWFGIGFAVMILVHEMGHFAEVKRRGLPADMPVFLPGLGAYVKWQALGVSTEVRALVSLAGPAAGLAAALVAVMLFWRTATPVWAALAHTGAWLNLLNLIPVWILDGAGAVLPLDRVGRGSLLVFSVLLFWWSGEASLLLVAAGFGWQLYRKEFPADGSVAVQLYYAVLIAASAWLLHITPLAR